MSETLTCPLCGLTERFTLVQHLRTAHGSEPGDFQTRFPAHALHSAEFSAFVKEHGVARHDAVLHFQLNVAGVRMTARFGVDHPLVPKPDPLGSRPAHTCARRKRQENSPRTELDFVGAQGTKCLAGRFNQGQTTEQRAKNISHEDALF